MCGLEIFMHGSPTVAVTQQCLWPQVWNTRSAWCCFHCSLHLIPGAWQDLPCTKSIHPLSDLLCKYTMSQGSAGDITGVYLQKTLCDTIRWKHRLQVFSWLQDIHNSFSFGLWEGTGIPGENSQKHEGIYHKLYTYSFSTKMLPVLVPVLVHTSVWTSSQY